MSTPRDLELLAQLHSEFYQGPLANADAFRILPRIIAELKSGFEALCAEHLEWCAATFPNENLDSIKAHLCEEMEEWGDNREDDGEIADVFLLLISLCARLGKDPVELMRKKMAINKARKWEGAHHVK